MQRLVNEVADSKSIRKQTLIENFISKNAYEIAELSKGQKSLRHFILNLNQFVDWFNVEPPELNVTGSIDKESNLSTVQKVSLNNTDEDLLNSCSTYTGESKSSIIRLCIIKGLYDNKKVLNNTKAKRISDLWTSAKRKLKTATKMMVTALDCSLEREFIEAKMETRREFDNLASMADEFNDFKQKEGYSRMLSYRCGDNIDQMFKDIVDHVE